MRPLDRPLGLIATSAGIVGGIALLALMLSTVVDVTLRSTLNFAFLGVTEITELGLVVVAAFGIAYCGWTEGHIALEFGDKLLSARTWQGLQAIERLASAIIVGTVGVYSIVEAVAVYRRSAHTNLLQIPEYPFYLIVGAGFLTYTIILLYRFATARRAEAAEPHA
jgi:TRAP-type C4-dicarboxylate transport system permease small subunit